MTLNQQVRQQLAAHVAQVAPDDIVQLNNALRLLSKWRSVLIQNTVLQQHGTLVRQGPLAELEFLKQSAEGCHVAKLLGTYEQPLQPYVEDAINRGYSKILNIGCAEGYYAVGMARCMPYIQVLAYDLDEKAQATCRELARKNGVAERLSIGALFNAEDFAHYAGQDVLVFCDIEGAEKQLLNPELAPALKGMDIIVESHECLVPGITQLLQQRFSHSHHITLVEDNGQRQLLDDPAWFRNLAHLDQLLAVWEWRSGPTPWLVMTPHGRQG
jgi:hypothetical protein